MESRQTNSMGTIRRCSLNGGFLTADPILFWKSGQYGEIGILKQFTARSKNRTQSGSFFKVFLCSVPRLWPRAAVVSPH